MTLDPDRLLFEQVFQRIVNLLAGLTTCYNLARSCIIGALVFEVSILVDYAAQGDWLNLGLMAGIDSVSPLVAYSMFRTIARTERHASQGILYDPFSPANRKLRWMWLVMTTTFILAAILTPARETMFTATTLFCLMSMAYFHDCIPAPPRRRNFIPAYFKKAFSPWLATPSSTSPTCSSVPGM